MIKVTPAEAFSNFDMEDKAELALSLMPLMMLQVEK